MQDGKVIYDGVYQRAGISIYGLTPGQTYEFSLVA
jgi:hypothetical protein